MGCPPAQRCLRPPALVAPRDHARGRAQAALDRTVLSIAALIPAALFTCSVIICLIKPCYGDYRVPKPFDFRLRPQPQNHQSFCVCLEGQSRVYVV